MASFANCIALSDRCLWAPKNDIGTKLHEMCMLQVINKFNFIDIQMLPAMFRRRDFEVEQVTGQDWDMVNLSTLISMFDLFSLLNCSSSLGIGDVLVDTTQGLDKGTIGKVCSRAVTKGLEDMNLPSIPLRKSNFGLL